LWTSRLAVSQIRVYQLLRRFFVNYGRKHYRKLPWRGRRVSAFQLLVAELLLKQTKTEDVARVWPALMTRFPTPIRMARAKRSLLVRLLRPLGLQRQRASHLLQVSKALVQRHRGQVPGEMAELLSLPGVGLYTAAAVACFKFGRRLPIVDANVLRVLGRVTGQELGADLRRARRAWEVAWSILPLDNWKQHNYGVLDFAAELCGASPRCNECPLRKKCFFAKSNC
jgi:A/G-specific adenine glycosylase